MEKASFRSVLVVWGLAVFIALFAGYASYRVAKYEQVVIGAAVDTVVCERKGEDCGPANLALLITKQNQKEMSDHVHLLWVLVALLALLPPISFYLLRWILVGRWRPWWPL